MSATAVARLSAIVAWISACSVPCVSAREFFVASIDRVQVFDHSGASVRAIGEQDDFLSGVWDVELGPDGKLYIANGGMSRVEKYDLAGNYLGVYGQTEVPGIDAFYPRALKFDRHGYLFVVSSTGGVRKFDQVGNDLGFFGNTTELPIDIRALEFDSQGNLYVSVTGAINSSGMPVRYGFVEVYAPDGSSLGTFGETANAQLLAPNGLAFDKAGNLYVSNGGGVEIFSPDGDWQGTFGETNILGPSAGSGLAFDSDGNLYAADFEKVIMFDPHGKSLGVFGDTHSVHLVNAYNLAIREVPEPTAVLMLLSGVILVAAGCRTR